MCLPNFLIWWCQHQSLWSIQIIRSSVPFTAWFTSLQALDSAACITKLHRGLDNPDIRENSRTCTVLVLYCYMLYITICHEIIINRSSYWLETPSTQMVNVPLPPSNPSTLQLLWPDLTWLWILVIQRAARKKIPNTEWNKDTQRLCSTRVCIESPNKSK